VMKLPQGRSTRLPARYDGSVVPIDLRAQFVSEGRTSAQFEGTTIEPQSELRATVVLVGAASWPQNIYLAEAVLNSGFRVEMVSCDDAPPESMKWLHVRSVEHFESDGFADLMCSLEKNDQVKWIIPIAEDAIWAVRQLLPDSTKVFSQFCAENAERLSSKQSMRVFAKSLGIPVPEEFRTDSLGEARLAAQSLGFPCVLKGQGGCGGAQVAICHNEQELNGGWEKLHAMCPSVQAFIEGTPWAAGGFFVNGQPFRVHLYEKLAQSPPGVGPPTRIRHDSPRALKESLFAIARTMNWTGFLQVDFIRAADGQFYFLEINPRPWGSMTAANIGGSDIFAPLIDVLHKRAPVADLENADGWSGYVFPKPALNQTASGHLGGAMLTLLSPKFWRSVPRGYSRATRSLLAEIFHLKRAYWGLSRRFDRNTVSH